MAIPLYQRRGSTAVAARQLFVDVHQYVFYAACQWGMLLVMARLGNPEIVGQFTLALAITTPVVSLGLLVTAAIVLILGYRGTLAGVIIVVGIAKAIEAVSDIFHAFLQQHERMDRIACSITIKGVLSLLVLAGAMYLTDSLLISVPSLTLTRAAILLTQPSPNLSSPRAVPEVDTALDTPLREKTKGD